MKLDFAYRNCSASFGSGYYVGPTELCSMGIYDVFGIVPEKLRLDIRTKNPRQKGFIKIKIGERSALTSKNYNIWFSSRTSQFLIENDLNNSTIWVKAITL